MRTSKIGFSLLGVDWVQYLGSCSVLTVVMGVGWQTLSAVAVTSIVDGLKKLYLEKLKPLEVAYRFNDFVSPTLVLS
jgi:hypothetical protein